MGPKEENKVKKIPFYKRKAFIITLIVIVVLLIVGVLAYRKLASTVTQVPDEYVDDGSYADVGMNNYYSGVVEAEQTWEIQKDAEREIAEVYVKEGDTVTAGQKLFSYDSGETKVSLEQAELEVDNYGNSISDYQNQIKNLTDQQSKAAEAEKADFQTQINQLNMNIRQAQLGQKTKQVEITELKKKLENATVLSTMDGVVKSIASGSKIEGAYMTILTTAQYRVKGSIDEMNYGSLTQGQKMIAHSRVSDQTWTGTVTKIDTESQTTSNPNNMYDNSGSGEASRYDFYVTLDNSDGLLLGQHVYLEPVYDDMPADGGMEALPEDQVTDEGTETTGDGSVATDTGSATEGDSTEAAEGSRDTKTQKEEKNTENKENKENKNTKNKEVKE